jgi:SAM-dependent methyltransferase
MSGWDESASAWITSLGQAGDKGRQFVLDRPMMARIAGRGFRRMLDVGCGEGRFCRLARPAGLETVGIDPTRALLARARALDPGGTYVEGTAESMPFPDTAFDLVVSYLSLIDIPDYRAAIAEMARVLSPGGTLLVANLTPMNTAGTGREDLRWRTDTAGSLMHYAIDHYMTERWGWEEWRGIRIANWHRPLSAYMQTFLGAGLTLAHFDEPLPHGGDPEWVERYKRMPWFVVMEWRKPAT